MDWTAVAAIGQVGAALITVWAVIVALRQGKMGKEQFLRARYDDNRPVLIVTSDSQPIETPPNWSTSNRKVKILNIGKGVAFHLRSVIYGPETSGEPHWYYWKAEAIRPEEEKELDHQRADPHAGVNQFETKNKHIKQYTFHAQGGRPTHLCRISLTYYDIFHRKHASIFDFVPNAGWQEVDCLEDIPQDLHDLETS